jgi:hypothetical protein
VSDRPLADLFDVSSVDRAADRMVKRVGDYMHDRVTLHTPVANPPAGVGRAEWIEARGGRRPGRLKRSWRIGRVERYASAGGERTRIEVFTMDPVAPHVEWPTRPHLIRPRRAAGVLRFWLGAGARVFAAFVEHPGTQGSFMMGTTLAEAEIRWRVVANQELARWAAAENARR